MPLGVPVSAVLSMREALAQPQLENRDFLMEMPPPAGFEDPLTVFNAAYSAAEDGPGTRLPPPAVGADTDDVLIELGFTPADIQSFRDDACI